MISHVLMKNNKPLLFLNVSELEDGREEFIYFINLHQLYSFIYKKYIYKNYFHLITLKIYSIIFFEL